jgi:hypothetical protein
MVGERDIFGCSEHEDYIDTHGNVHGLRKKGIGRRGPDQRAPLPREDSE